MAATDNISNGIKRNEFEALPTADISTTVATTPTINYNTSTYDDNNKANIIAHSIHRKDKTIKQLTKWSLAANNNNRRIKSSSPKEFKTASHHQQQQQHYHGKQRHQFHLEQQQKHQQFKQVNNAERMVTSIALKLTLVAWDIWAFRNVY